MNNLDFNPKSKNLKDWGDYAKTFLKVKGLRQKHLRRH